MSYTRLGCCFEYDGPAKSLLIALKYQDKPYLAKSLASFLLLQHHELSWELPDLITYIPQSFLRASLRGYNQSALLAQNLGLMMQRPVESHLLRTSFGLTQTLLSKEERKRMAPDVFALKRNINLQGKRVLLVDDVLTTGTTIECASRALQAAHPASLDVLCLLRTEV